MDVVAPAMVSNRYVWYSGVLAWVGSAAGSNDCTRSRTTSSTAPADNSMLSVCAPEAAADAGSSVNVPVPYTVASPAADRICTTMSVTTTRFSYTTVNVALGSG